VVKTAGQAQNAAVRMTDIRLLSPEFKGQASVVKTAGQAQNAAVRMTDIRLLSPEFGYSVTVTGILIRLLSPEFMSPEFSPEF
jgi:hypothetical protein